MKYMSASEAAAKWGLSSRRVGLLCNEGRIEGAQKGKAKQRERISAWQTERKTAVFDRKRTERR